MYHLQAFRNRFDDDDTRFNRTYNRYCAGDHVRIIGGRHQGKLGYIGYIHQCTNTDRPPVVTIITVQGEEIVCGFANLQLTEDDTSSDDTDSDPQPTAPSGFPHDILDGMLVQLSLQVTGMLLMKDDPKKQWKHFKRITTDNINEQLQQHQN